MLSIYLMAIKHILRKFFDYNCKKLWSLTYRKIKKTITTPTVKTKHVLTVTPTVTDRLFADPKSDSAVDGPFPKNNNIQFKI